MQKIATAMGRALAQPRRAPKWWLALISVWVPLAIAQPLEIVGFTIGAALDRDIPRCGRGATDDWCSVRKPISPNSIPEFTAAIRGPTSGDPKVRVPSWVDDASISFDETNVIEVLKLNLRPDRQADAIHSLKGRFGEPAMIETRQLQNRAGFKFSYTYATWEHDGSLVRHSCETFERCSVTIASATWVSKQTEAQSKRREADKL